MTTKPTVILVTVERLQDWFVAKSNDLTGLCMAASDMSRLVADIPNVIRMLYLEQHGVNVDVQESGGGDTTELNPLRYMLQKAA